MRMTAASQSLPLLVKLAKDENNYKSAWLDNTGAGEQ